MRKKLKVTTYEKDNDDHYVVVLNPWAKGVKQRSQVQIDWMGAWLRLAFRNPVEKDIVKNIYTVETRNEVIVRIDTSINTEVGLGLHRWGEFMEYRDLEKIRMQAGVDFSEEVSHIFLYNWKLHGDPAERQWQEWFPRQDTIPSNTMIKREYPVPGWTEIPPVDTRLRSFLIPMPRIPDLGYDSSWNTIHNAGFETLDAKTPVHNTVNAPRAKETKARADGRRSEVRENSIGPPRATALSTYETPLHLPHTSSDRMGEHNSGAKRALGPGKVGKLDPFEEDDAARAVLSTGAIKQESFECTKLESEDVKPDIRNTGYKPSVALSDAVLKLRRQDSRQPGRGNSVNMHQDCLKAEEQDIKPSIPKPTYRPSGALVTAISRFNNGSRYPECEDRKPLMKQEDYSSSIALSDPPSNTSTSGTGLSRNPKRSSRNDSSASSSSMDSRAMKRKRLGSNHN